MQSLEFLLNEVKKRPNEKNVLDYCEALDSIGFVEKNEISKQVKLDLIDDYDQSYVNRFIQSKFKNKSQSRNSKIGVIKRGLKSLATDMVEPVTEISEKIN